MKRTLLGLLAVLVVGVGAWAQSEVPANPALFHSGDAIAAELAKEEIDPGGHVVSIVETEDFGVSVRRRTDRVQQYAPVHPLSTEVYRILDGSGTILTGGVLDPPSPPATPDRPDNLRSSGVKGGTPRDLKAGDVVVIPAGSPHQFIKVNGSITYIEVRIRSTWPGVSAKD